MKVLFVHQNFPGQYLHLARHLGSSADNEVLFITQRADGEIPGVRKLVYKPRRTSSPQVHHYLRESEGAVLNAQEVAASHHIKRIDLRHQRTRLHPVRHPQLRSRAADAALHRNRRRL